MKIFLANRFSLYIPDYELRQLKTIRLWKHFAKVSSFASYIEIRQKNGICQKSQNGIKSKVLTEGINEVFSPTRGLNALILRKNYIMILRLSSTFKLFYIFLNQVFVKMLNRSYHPGK